MILREEDDGGRAMVMREFRFRVQVMEISSMSSRENLVCERENLI